ncbi:hypothetical protein HY483_02785 [Candidatus Woesearchaeota archaeon]|nr:hypothetical protein [Candidatus Woesearchaeota archaeon]
MSETAIRNIPASARNKKAVSDHDQEPNAPGFSSAVLDISMRSSFSRSKQALVDALVSGSIDVDSIEQRSSRAVSESSKILEAIINSDPLDISGGVVDSWRHSLQSVVVNDLGYVDSSTRDLRIVIESALGVPFEVREKLKTLQSSIKSCNSVKRNLPRLKSEAGRVISEMSTCSSGTITVFRSDICPYPLKS